MVLAGTPHAEFWDSMTVLGWAILNQPDLNISLPDKLKVYAFNEEGIQIFPAFIERFNLPNIVVNEEQPEIRAMLNQHIDEVFTEAAQSTWLDLADQLPINVTHVKPNKWDYYIGSTIDAKWSKKAGGSIEIIVNGFLHPSHYKPIFTKNMTLHKYGKIARFLDGNQTPNAAAFHNVFYSVLSCNIRLK